MPSPESRAAEIRELEVELEQSLLALDYAQQRQEPVFAAVARVAEVQLQLDRLRGTVTNPARRAAWLAHLAGLDECQAVHDGPAVAYDTPPAPRPRVRYQRPTNGAKVEFPKID